MLLQQQQQQQDDEQQPSPSSSSNTSSSPWEACKTVSRACWVHLRLFTPTTWFYLIVLGALGALTSFCIDSSVSFLFDSKLDMADTGSTALNFFVWVPVCCAFALFASLLCDALSREAEGSGIPEMKAFLGGSLNQTLNFPTMVAKVVGLTFALSSGIFVGKEGPFVHIAAMLAHFLLEIPLFRRLSHNPALKRQLYIAAVAAGVTMAFGTPIGGVLFSIEVTATYFLVSNLWKSFFCITFTVFFLKTFDSLGTVELFSDKAITHFEAYHFSPEILAFAFLGVLCGFLGVVFIYCSWWWMDTKRAGARNNRRLGLVHGYLARLTNNRYLFTAAVAGFTAVMAFGLPMFRDADRETITDMFLAGKLRDVHEDHEHAHVSSWLSPSLYFNLFVFVIIKLALTSVAISLPLPAGVLTPIFAAGAAFGRLYGEMLAAAFPNSNIHPGAYAIVGAAALSSAVTRTLSISIIIFELTRQISHSLPVLLAMLVAYSICGGFTLSIYDLILNMKKLPVLSAMHRSSYGTSAGTVMQFEDIPALTKFTTYREIGRLVHSSDLPTFPLVDEENNRLLRSVSRERLLLEVFFMEKLFSRRLREEDRDKFIDLVHERVDAEEAARDQAWRKERGSRGRRLSGPIRTLHHRPWFERVTTYLQSRLFGSGSQTRRARSPSGAGPANYVMLEEGQDSATSSPGSGHSDEDASAHAPEPDEREPEPQHELLSRFDDFTNVPVQWYKLGRMGIDAAPLQISEDTPLSKVRYYFAMLDLQLIFVTGHNGQLVGIISKEDLLGYNL